MQRLSQVSFPVKAPASQGSEMLPQDALSLLPALCPERPRLSGIPLPLENSASPQIQVDW